MTHPGAPSTSTPSTPAPFTEDMVRELWDRQQISDVMLRFGRGLDTRDWELYAATDLDEYVEAITQVGALRAGLAVYQDFFTSADQVAARAKTPLAIPVRGYGGEACLGGATLASVQAVAPAAEGGVIDRCGHWAAEERPDFVARLAAELAEAS